MQPFRWNLIKREQLGGLLNGRTRLLDDFVRAEIVAMTARAVARSSDGDLYFVGRSLHSGFDFLSGLFEGTPYALRLHLLPMSVRCAHQEQLSDPMNVQAFRSVLRESGLTIPLKKGSRVTFVDVVASGETFGFIATSLADWQRDEGRVWEDLRSRLRFVGVVCRGKSSPNTWRWQQHRNWGVDVRESQLQGISVDGELLGYLASSQKKTNGPHVAERWLDPETVRHDDDALTGLAEAAAWYDLGKTAEARALFKQTLNREPTMKEEWLRSVAAMVA